MVVCPFCQESQGQVKAGKSETRQRFRCSRCQRRYTPEARTRGYPADLRQRAVGMYAQGLKMRQISRNLGVNHQTVANWLRQTAPHEEAPAGGGGETAAIAPPPDSPEPFSTQSTVVTSLPAGMRGQVSSGSGEAGAARKERATIEDVARYAGVSATTISNFINAKGRMSAATQGRIQRAMEELHFTPSALTRAIRQRRTRILGLLVFGLGNLDEEVGKSITPPLVAGIYEAAEQAEQDILVFTGWPNRPERHSGLDFLNGHIDGLLWVAPPLQTSALERLAAAGLPVVALLARHVPEAVGYVNADNLAAIGDVVAHLRADGRKRIAYLGPVAPGGSLNSNLLDRLEGYRRGLYVAGLPHDPALEVVSEAHGWRERGCAEALEGWLQLPVPPDAIVTSSDSLAARLCEAIRSRGLRVPEDIAVTGFNDIPDARHLGGGITTIRQPFREIGKLAANRLVALIEGASVEACRLTVPAHLVVRASTKREP